MVVFAASVACQEMLHKPYVTRRDVDMRVLLCVGLEGHLFMNPVDPKSHMVRHPNYAHTVHEPPSKSVHEPAPTH